MSIKVKDADGIDIYLKGTGAGSVGDPFVSDAGLLQPLTNAELRAAALLVSGTFYQATQPVSSVSISVVAAISGQVTVTTPGTSVQGSDVALTNGVYVKALAANTGKMYIGYATGDNRAKWELSADQLILVQVTNLNQLWFDASVGSEKICWLKA